MTSPRRRRRAWAVVAAVACLIISSAAGVAVAEKADPAMRAIQRVMDKPRYTQAEWGMLEVDPQTGRATRSMQRKRAFVPGSVAKIFVVSAMWNVLGPDHRFETPVYAIGERNGSTLTGDLVLKASGDLTLGGRVTSDGELAYADVDHTYANDVPGAAITPQDPLAGLDEIAKQIRAAGITRVDGDVAIDARLWQPDPALVGEDPGTNPILVNENVVDVQITPTQPGEPAELLWRPQTAAIQVDSQVQTGPNSSDSDWEIQQLDDGRFRAIGSIPAGADAELRVIPIDDPASFARTALIEALGRAGVSVTAPAIAANPTQALRDSYDSGGQVAVYVSPPLREYARVILKVSHNVGAQVALCQLAVDAGSDDCADGFAVERRFLKRAGVNVDEVALADGRGGNPYNRVTPRATVQLLRWWTKRDDFRTFQHSLPILGVDGDLALSGTKSPARGKVFAKTGAAAGPDSLNGRLTMPGKAMAGYLAGEHGGAPRPFALFMNNAYFPSDPANIFVASSDLARISAVMQQNELP